MIGSEVRPDKFTFVTVLNGYCISFEHTMSRSSLIPVPVIADMGIGVSLASNKYKYTDLNDLQSKN